MKDLTKFLCKSLMFILFLPFAVTSCYDDSAIWDKFDDIENRIDSLANELNKQMEALNLLMKDGSTISSCVENKDGSYSVTLSNGITFKVMPQGTDFSKLVTYKEINGSKFWAVYGPDGVPEAITGDDGKTIPVETRIEVKLIDGVYYLVANGKEYVTGYDAEDVVQVFSSCTPLTDASGNVYAVRFTFGEGMEITVALDGYAGIIFRLPGASNPVVSEYFIDYGTTQSFLLDAEGVIDYVMQVPDGWRVSERHEELTAETFIDITAPASSTVGMGAAVAKGELKVVSVVEGGKASVSKLVISADPFKKYDLSTLKVVVEPFEGIQKFVYGVMLYEDFDEDKVMTTVNELLRSSNDLPEGYHLAEAPIENTYAEIYGSEISVEQSYVFWIVPALYAEGDDSVEAGFYAREDMLRQKLLNPVDLLLKVSDVTLLDAQLKVKAMGVSSLFAGVAVNRDGVLDEIIYQVNNGIVEPYTDILSYTGPVSTFPSEDMSVLIEPSTEYMVWVLPVDAGKTEYSVTDIVYEEFATPGIVAGGTTAVTVGDFTVGQSSISSQITAEGASMIYYAYLSEQYGRYAEASNETKMKYLMAADTFTAVRGSSAEASIERLMPETEMWLYAAAISADGCYGDVYAGSAKTDAVQFNDITLTVTELSIASNSASFSVTASGGTPVEYLYWVGRESDPFWYATCNKSKLDAQKYMAANPDDSQIISVMNQQGAINADGTISFKDLLLETTYVFVVLAKDESGNYSKAGYKKFSTLSIALGDDFAEEGSDRWNSVKDQIQINWHTDRFRSAEHSNMYAYYEFDITIPKEYTAYIYCISELYFEQSGMDTPAKIIYNVVNDCSRSYDADRVAYDENGEFKTEPDWVDDKGTTHRSSLMNIYNFYVHGYPTNGFATYFAEGWHVEDHCTSWSETDGSCSNYQHALSSIQKRLTLEYYIDYVKRTRGNYLWEEESIKRVAQDLMDAYYPYYENAEPLLCINNGEALHMEQHYASGPNDEGVVLDDVYVVLKDKDNNFFAPFVFDVPNHFK